MRGAVAVAVLLLSPSPSVLLAQDGGASAEPARSVVRRHAEHCSSLYAECVTKGEAMRRAVRELLAAPGERTLREARAAWAAARVVYGETEALRFRGGPIDAIEPLLNAWPVDEAYIDHVVGRPDAGLVNDRRGFPVLGAEVLCAANERGGETNVCVGWHAIEFLLWGQDLDPAGPGNRPASDFADGAAGAARRREYLTIVVDLLVNQLTSLREAWAPDAPARRRFESDVAGSVRAMLTGAAVLTAFEMCGERLAVAYETRDQEQEHSCFSDTTCDDLVADQRGVMAVFADDRGPAGAPDLLSLVRAKDPAAADHLRRTLDETLRALRAIPAPFDRAFLGADDAPGRRAMRAAMEALEQQTEAITIAGRLLGHELPLRPGN